MNSFHTSIEGVLFKSALDKVISFKGKENPYLMQKEN